MSSSVRDIEVLFGGIEDTILDSLGYREYEVTIGANTVTPRPEVINKPLQAFSDGQIRQFIDSLGGQGNPIAYFKVIIARTFLEAIVRDFAYWTLTRETYEAQCLPVQIKVTDSRYEVLLGVLKQSTEPTAP